jgi:NtrC-family two-component system sensor histidine kinase KinB
MFEQSKTLRLSASQTPKEGKNFKDNGFICMLGDISASKELDRVKENFVATLTHDLKTPLLAQELVLNSLLSDTAGNITPGQKKLITGASDSVRDLLAIVNATLVFYKLESSHLTLHKQRTNPLDMVKEVMETLQPLAAKRELRLEVDSSLSLPNISADPIQLKRVFHNLISNALSYAEAKTPVRVSLQPELNEDGTSETIQIIVENEGKGISPEELPKIFDKFHSMSRKFKQIGTGLGLYISKRIVELHGGKIWAESEPGKITRFYVTLPTIQQI